MKKQYHALGLLPVSVIFLCILHFSCQESTSNAQLLLHYSDNTCAGDSIYEPGEVSGTSFDPAIVEVFIEGHEVTLNHKNAFLNCCLDSIAVRLDQSVDTIRLFEDECVTTPCDCICPFEVIAMAAVPGPGIYIFEIWTQGNLVWRRSLVIGL